MNSPRLIPAATVTTYHDTQRAEVFVVTVDGKSRELSTVQFFEKRPDLGEIEVLKKANWKVKVPENQTLFMATAGQRRDALKTSWVGWKNDAALNGLSLFLEKPVSVPLLAIDRLIDPPVIVNRKMHQYFFRTEGGRSQLWRHEFAGDMGQPGACQTVKVLDLTAGSATGAAAPVPGPDGQVVVAWVQADEQGLRVGAALIKGEPEKVLHTASIAALKPIERLRLGVYTASKALAQVTCVAQKPDGSAYQVVEAVCDFENGAAKTQTQPLKLPPNTLHAAASFYLKLPEEAQGFTCLLNKQGTLFLYENERLREWRRAVPLQYDFPMVTTLGARHEAVMNAKGEIEMHTVN